MSICRESKNYSRQTSFSHRSLLQIVATPHISTRRKNTKCGVNGNHVWHIIIVVPIQHKNVLHLSICSLLGFSGKKCETKRDNCAESPCMNGQCVDDGYVAGYAPDAYHCECNQGELEFDIKHSHLLLFQVGPVKRLVVEPIYHGV